MTIAVKDATGATVNVEAPNANGQATMANSRPVVIASNQSNLPVVGTSTNSALSIASFGQAAADGASNASTAVPFLSAGGVGIASITAGMVFNGTAWDRLRGDTIGSYTVAKPATSGGASIARLVASAGANLKASAGQLYGGVVTNSNAAIRYLHFYNKATSATLSTDTPVATFALPPNASVQITTDGLGAAFATGISWAFTTDDIAIPTTAGATTDLHGTLFYK